MRQWWLGLGSAALVCSGGCSANKSNDPGGEGPAAQEPAPDPGDWGDGPMRFAVIGDFGDDNLASLGIGGEDKVAELIKSWNVHFVVTAGDNNYPNGSATTIDANIGKYFSEFIGDYQGEYGSGSATNRFWPTPGNHDWKDEGLKAYLDYFTLPGNERYYDKQLGYLHLFALDSDGSEPDGADRDSVQAQWFQQVASESTACFKLAVFHHPPYSSGKHGNSERMQWPFGEWGMDAVVSGHDHVYERVEQDGLPYFVNGLGGSLKYSLGEQLENSALFYQENFGAQLVTVTSHSMALEFYNVDGDLIDTRTIAKDCE